MAMDKDRLLQYFQQLPFSRQEVLFKLPLNVSIDTFWPELLNHAEGRSDHSSAVKRSRDAVLVCADGEDDRSQRTALRGGNGAGGVL